MQREFAYTTEKANTSSSQLNMGQRANGAYDNSDNSMRSANTYGGDYRNYKVDYDEYWKTNI